MLLYTEWVYAKLPSVALAVVILKAPIMKFEIYIYAKLMNFGIVWLNNV